MPLVDDSNSDWISPVVVPESDAVGQLDIAIDWVTAAYYVVGWKDVQYESLAEARVAAQQRYREVTMTIPTAVQDRLVLTVDDVISLLGLVEDIAQVENVECAASPTAGDYIVRIGSNQALYTSPGGETAEDIIDGLAFLILVAWGVTVTDNGADMEITAVTVGTAGAFTIVVLSPADELTLVQLEVAWDNPDRDYLEDLLDAAKEAADAYCNNLFLDEDGNEADIPKMVKIGVLKYIDSIYQGPFATAGGVKSEKAGDLSRTYWGADQSGSGGPTDAVSHYWFPFRCLPGVS